MHVLISGCAGVSYIQAQKVVTSPGLYLDIANYPLAHIPTHSSMLCTQGELGQHFVIPHPILNSAAIAMLFELEDSS